MEGRMEGRMEGLQEGQLENTFKVIRKATMLGVDANTIAQMVELPLAEVVRIMETVRRGQA